MGRIWTATMMELGVSSSGILRTASALILSLFVTLVSAKEQAEVCIKYRKDFGWSKGYAVEGTVMTGSELNSAVGSFTRFRAFSTYVVVFWDEGEASIFQLPASSIGHVPMYEMEVEDQQGRKWKIKEGHSFCY